MSRFLIMMLAVISINVVTACDGEDGLLTDPEPTETPTPTPTTNNPPVGVVTDSDGFYVRTIESLDYTYYMHKNEPGKYLDECKIAEGASYEQVDCVLEGKEEDLWFWGAKLQYNIPKSMCDYFTFEPYYYYALKPEYVGHVDISVEQTTAGVFQNEVSSNANVYLAGNEVRCKANYGQTIGVNYPNCCVGDYTLTVSYPGAAPAVPAAKYPGKFGGSAANCLDGPAMQLEKSPSGWPIVHVENIAGVGANKVFEINDPGKHPLWGSPVNSSNVYVANYYNDTDATANDYIGGSAGNKAFIVNKYHEFSCYDRTFELKNRIRVQIRSWDRDEEFDAMLGTKTKNSISSSTEAETYGIPYATSCPIDADTTKDPDGNAYTSGFPGAGIKNRLGCSSTAKTYDRETNGIDPTHPIQDHWDWRTHFLYWKYLYNNYTGSTATSFYPGHTLVSHPYETDN